MQQDLFTQEESERIKRCIKKNEGMENLFNDKRKEWMDEIEPLFDVMKKSFTAEASAKILEAQGLALSYRQALNEEISVFLNKRTKEAVKLKEEKQKKFLFYATGFGLKTNMSEKSVLIDAHLAENERSVELIDSYIEFLRGCMKNIEAFQFSIKNTIELMNYLGR